MYCDHPDCTHTTFAERFDFVASNGKKTKRLVDKILMTSANLSSVNASFLLKADSVKASKSKICDLLKKMPSFWINQLSQKSMWMTLLFVKGTPMVQSW